MWSWYIEFRMGRGMEVIEGKWFVKGLKQSGRKGIRMCFCETKVELGKVGVLYEVKRGDTCVR